MKRKIEKQKKNYMLTEDVYFGRFKNPAGYRVCLMESVEYFICISWYNNPSAYIILSQGCAGRIRIIDVTC